MNDPYTFNSTAKQRREAVRKQKSRERRRQQIEELRTEIDETPTIQRLPHHVPDELRLFIDFYTAVHTGDTTKASELMPNVLKELIKTESQFNRWRRINNKS